jgi:hypothetical protein
MKTCYSCKETKELTEFYKNKSIYDGHSRECKRCILKYYYQKKNDKNFLEKKREIAIKSYWKIQAPKRKRRSENTFGKGETHSRWLGDNIGYTGIHLWLNKMYEKIGICELCKQKNNTDFALIPGKEYKRKRENYFEICRSCHSKIDNKYKNFKREKCYA